MDGGVLPQKEVGGRVFSFKTIPATRAVRVVLPLARVLANGLQDIDLAILEPGKAGGDGNQNEAILKALSALLEKLDADEFVKVQVTVFESVLCKGRPIIGEDGINETFGSNVEDLMKVFAEAMGVNLRAFFPGGLSGLIGEYASKLKASTPPISTGSSSPP